MFRKLILVLILIIILIVGCSNENTVSVEILSETSGKIKGAGVYKSGQNVNLEAMPSKGYQFIGWKDEELFVSDEKNYNFEIEKDRNFTARFEKKKNQLKIINQNPDMGSVSGQGKYIFDEIAKVSARAKEGYKFVGWFNSEEVIITEEDQFETVVNSNIEYAAKFEPIKFSIVLDKNIEKGNVYGAGEYQKGKKQFIRAEILTGYDFQHWIDSDGNIFSKKDGKMITVDKNLNLTAVYEKKDQEFYLGVSTDEILEILQSAYESYFDDNNPYSTLWLYKKPEAMSDALREGNYYISTQPNSFKKFPMNDGNPIEFEIKNIQVIDNKIIVNSIIKVPKLVNNIDKNRIKKELKNNLINLNEYFSNYFQYDLTNKNIYEKELVLKVENDEIIIESFDQPHGIFSKYKEFYDELVYDSIDRIDLYVDNGSFSKIEFYYDGKKYSREYNIKIFDNRDLFPKIYVIYNNLEFNFGDFFMNLRSNVNRYLEPNKFLLEDISFYKDKKDKHLIIKIQSFFEMDAQLVFSIYDNENNDFSYSNVISGVLVDEIIMYSPNNEYISYVHTESSGIEKLEIMNILSTNRLQINDYLEEFNINSGVRTIFKSIEWHEKSNALRFDLYLKFDDTNEEEDATVRTGTFIFDINTKKLSRVIKDGGDSKNNSEPMKIVKYDSYTEKDLTTIELPDTVITIDTSAFYDKNLKSVKIPNSVTTIKDNAFYNNELTTVEIPNSVTSIGASAFWNNELTSVEISDSITSIKRRVFAKNNLISVKIPNSVITIGEDSFSNNKITSLLIPNSVTSIGNFAFSGNSLKSLVLPDSIKTIGGYAFSRNALTSITIPDSVTYIDHGAFNDNNITTVEIPKGCKYADNAFDDNVKIIQK